MNQPTHPPTHEQIKKTWSIYSREFNSDKTEQEEFNSDKTEWEILLFVTKWMGMKDILLNIIRYIESNAACFFHMETHNQRVNKPDHIRLHVWRRFQDWSLTIK